jgi:hypothetical protein
MLLRIETGDSMETLIQDWRYGLCAESLDVGKRVDPLLYNMHLE